MKCQIPAIAEANNIQHTGFRQIAANLLGETPPNVLGDLLGTSHMRRHLGNCLEDEMKNLIDTRSARRIFKIASNPE